MPEIVQWVVDTTQLWTEAKTTKDLETVAKDELNWLSTGEKQQVTKFVFVKDAKMSLASCLMKRLLISRYAQVPWEEAIALKDPITNKPAFRIPGTGKEPVAFNVSHQDGLVVAVAVCGYNGGDGSQVDVGVDVVSTAERRMNDIRALTVSRGWEAHVNIFSEVFSQAEVEYLQTLPVPKEVTLVQDQCDYKLRHFYMLWAMREAYVKMDGQALLAPWIKDLTFKDFHPPKPVDGVVDFDNIHIYDTKVEDCQMKVHSWGETVMIATAIRTRPDAKDALGWTIDKYQNLDLLAELKKFAD